jgi:hypothetical protein
MKALFKGLGIFVLVSVLVLACGNPASSDAGGDALGPVVYTTPIVIGTVQVQTGLMSPSITNTSCVVTAKINGVGFSPAVTGTYTKADKTLVMGSSIPVPDGTFTGIGTTTMLNNIDSAVSWSGETLTASANTAKTGILKLEVSDSSFTRTIYRGIWSQTMIISPLSVTQLDRKLFYVYTSEAFTITAPYKQTSSVVGSQTFTYTYNAVNVTLSPGWNIIEYNGIVKQDASTNVTNTYSIGYPSKPLENWYLSNNY